MIQVMLLIFTSAVIAMTMTCNPWRKHLTVNEQRFVWSLMAMYLLVQLITTLISLKAL